MNSEYLSAIDYLLKHPEQEDLEEEVTEQKKERKKSQKEIFYLPKQSNTKKAEILAKLRNKNKNKN